MNAGKIIFGGVVSLLAGMFVSMSAAPAVAQYGGVISGTGPINRSMGGAATASPLSAAGALYWNPATLSGLKSSELDIGAELLFPHAQMSSTVGAASGTTKNEDAVFPLPTIALAFRPDGSPITFGFGLFAVAGFGLDYAGNEANPVQASTGLGFGPIFSQYQVLQVAPAVSLQLTDQLSVSFSPLLDIGSAQLDPAVFATPNPSGYPSGMHSRSSWGAGFSLGTYYKAGDWGLGASYKSQQWFTPFRFSAEDDLGAPRSFEFNLDVPAITSVGASYSGIEHILLAVDLRYIDYENADGFGQSGFVGGALQGVGFESIFAVAMGAQYQMTDAVSVRVGYLWNENPVPDSQTSANVASPVVIQHQLSFGASYQMTDALSLSLAYAHAFENSIQGSIIDPGTNAPIPGTSIRSAASIDMVMFGATVKFGGSKR